MILKRIAVLGQTLKFLGLHTTKEIHYCQKGYILKTVDKILTPISRESYLNW